MSKRSFGRSLARRVQSPVVGQLVNVVVADGVATVTLDSPANRNALSQQLLADFHAALDTAEAQRARVVVLTHTAPVLCAGADLKERSTGRVDSTSRQLTDQCVPVESG